MKKHRFVAQRATSGTTKVLPSLAVVGFALWGGILARADDPSPDPCLGVDCPAIDDCHQRGVCDPASGGCLPVFKSNGTPCQDYNSATDNDVCTDGVCAGVFNLCFAVDCRPLNDCHRIGTCNPVNGQCSQPIALDGTRCEDGNTATINDICRNGVCAGTFNPCFAVDCPAFGQCHIRGECNPQTGACSQPSKPNGTPCNDSNPNTIDDICFNGDCAGEYTLCPGVFCEPVDDPCLVNLCEPPTGNCIIEALPDGLLCDDGDPLTYDDACLDGECVGIEDRCKDVVCNPPEQCHESACNPMTGACESSFSPAGTPCDDGWPGTDDACRNAACEGTSIYEWSGFLSPLSNWPTENLVSAGAVVVINFRLGGNFGRDILLSGSPASSPMTCGSSALLDGDQPTGSVGGGLTYDATTDQYSYRWSTNRVWAGTCRQLVLHLDDGRVFRANLRFRGAPGPRAVGNLVFQ